MPLIYLLIYQPFFFCCLASISARASFLERLILPCWSISTTFTTTSSPGLTTSSTFSTRLKSSLEMWQRPSFQGAISTKAPVFGFTSSSLRSFISITTVASGKGLGSGIGSGSGTGSSLTTLFTISPILKTYPQSWQ